MSCVDQPSPEEEVLGPVFCGTGPGAPRAALVLEQSGALRAPENGVMEVG